MHGRQFIPDTSVVLEIGVRRSVRSKLSEPTVSPLTHYGYLWHGRDKYEKNG